MAKLKLKYIKSNGNEATLELQLLPASAETKLKVKTAEKLYVEERAKRMQQYLGDGAELQRILSYTELMDMARSNEMIMSVAGTKDEEGNESIVGKLPANVLEKLSSITKKVEDAVEADLADWRNVMICKELIDTSKLNDEHKELIESEPDSEFWIKQPSSILRDAVNSFRRD